ncbi:uncharacterized protein N7479_001913 [Penicillium vulpinum]|uniref:Piwi domain-containing protein n=1 Tax=Penicillium vulpinum TaxID=29845 RepID=A0A1V6S414_9EURO|nr:uncharacterized protein N7479_001913 [Penicillium vulpinum]KAJ5971995.1 hypothetical protein N7479_001913 [Penicillium vulpinum]OQE08782.1 hypothetical protein PENVUL_c008G00139 [Penicillium vulpinum]
MSGRAHGDLPIRGSRSSGDRGGSRGRGDGGSSSRGSDRGYSGDRGRGSDRGSGHGGRGGSSRPQKFERMLKDPVEAPSTRVQALEDRYLAESTKARPEPNSLARRPGYGTQGRPIVLRANFFPMEFKPNVKFYSYRLKIKPDVKKGQQKFILESMLRQYPLFTDGKVGVATDGATEIVTTGPLPENRKPFTCSMGHGTGSSNVYTGPWNATLALDSSYSPADMAACLEDVTRREELENESSCLRVLNILMSAYPFKNSGTYIIGKGRNKFFWMDKRKQWMALGDGAEAVRGFYSSVRLGAGRIMLNLNVSHGAFFLPRSLIDVIKEFEANHNDKRDRVQRYLKGLKVYAMHLEPRKNGLGVNERPIKSILGVATPRDGRSQVHPPMVKQLASSADNVKFWMGDDKAGEYISITQYFLRTYNIKLKYANDKPVVNVGTRERPVYLPMEVCEVLPGQPFHPELVKIQRQNIIKFSCRRPPENYESIMKDGLAIMGIDEDHTKTVGIRISKQMITVHARILSAPNLIYGGKKNTSPRYGSWNLVSTRFAQGANISKWTCLWLRKRSSKPEHELKNPEPSMDALYRKLRDHGLSLPAPSKPYLSCLLIDDDQENRAMIKAQFAELSKSRFSLVVVLLPTTDSKIFDFVKYSGDIKTGILTHCMHSEKVMKISEQYMSNNAMKINLKMGGCNQLLQPTSARFIGAAKTTMVVGLDVTHPSSTDPDIFPSVAAIVASIDYRMAQWPGEVRAQTRRQEHIEFLKDMMLTRLKLWKDTNGGHLPQNILIYRDGVSDGQFPMVLTEELPKVQAATKAVYRGALPNITIVVCGKRHNVRFYPTKSTEEDKTSNPINGCVVDRGVTRPIYWDFYLQAQCPLQGTARPAHYIVIHDEIFTNSKVNTDRRPADVLQEITHNICYMMGRATRSISYSTPAFLADKFCDRARKYLLAHWYDQNMDIDNINPSILTLPSNLRDSMVYI